MIEEHTNRRRRKADGSEMEENAYAGEWNEDGGSEASWRGK